MKITADQLFKIRKVYRLTQTDIGALCDVSDAFINQIEHNKRSITDKVCAGITRELNLTPTKLQQIIDIYEKFDIKSEQPEQEQEIS
ncbi:transcriptional regulator with XRE-family HTH domain [Pullulanibacillus pueri]|uniref:HTH cro/C1-type domain-containing protein n=1 Tax=Pullulanibacillus pueri TaxID=1437324 RepID=A0A8J2ZXP4_9BACL|nr:helix-turn-helix transcriptional regulator [Pullulanibacillus pueri]MBM7683732.1 transcriptional regulator with XRE-family HTH domain [Pullulanibacillus pueri]GGH85132.1 hypothetical protein GCM10007096_29810 [Pullulanibacillus pueri]